LLTDDLLELFIDNNVVLKITIDGVGEVHNRRRRPRNNSINAYETIIDNIRKVTERGRSDLLDIRMNLDYDNLLEVEELAREMYTLGITNFYCGRVLFRGKRTEYDNKIISEEEFDRSIDYKLYEILKEYGFSNTPSSIKLNLPCQFYNHFGYVIAPDLKVAKCDELLDIPEHTIGYINDKGKLIYTNGNYQMQSSSSPDDYEQCRNCKLLPVCGSGCPIVSLNTKGSIYTNSCTVSEESIKLKLTNILNAHPEYFNN
jgi:uncharacterized protein